MQAFIQEGNALTTIDSSLDRAMQCESVQDFFEALTQTRRSVQAITEKNTGAATLQKELERSSANVRRSRVLQACAWSALSVRKTQGQYASSFGIPVVLTFGEGSWKKPDELTQKLLEARPAQTIQDEVGHLLPEKAFLGNRLFRSEDLLRHGPVLMHDLLFSAMANDTAELPPPRRLTLDSEIDCWRSLAFFVAGATPVTSGSPFRLDSFAMQQWPEDSLALAVAEALMNAGVQVDRVACLPPCSLAECAFSCSGPSYYELGENLRNAHSRYGELEVSIRFSMDGIAELSGTTPEGADIILAPPLVHTEPRAVFTGAVKGLCELADMAWAGAYALAMSETSMLQ